MPAKRAKGERLLEDALADLARALDSAGAPWMVIGGIAVIAHGVRRFTTDIDVAVRGDAISIDRLLDALADGTTAATSPFLTPRRNDQPSTTVVRPPPAQRPAAHPTGWAAAGEAHELA